MSAAGAGEEADRLSHAQFPGGELVAVDMLDEIDGPAGSAGEVGRVHLAAVCESQGGALEGLQQDAQQHADTTKEGAASEGSGAKLAHAGGPNSDEKQESSRQRRPDTDSGVTRHGGVGKPLNQSASNTNYRNHEYRNHDGRPTPDLNIHAFFQATTPMVSSVEYRLEELWQWFDQPYGHEVPLILKNLYYSIHTQDKADANLPAFYVPHLSAIQLFPLEQLPPAPPPTPAAITSSAAGEPQNNAAGSGGRNGGAVSAGTGWGGASVSAGLCGSGTSSVASSLSFSPQLPPFSVPGDLDKVSETNFLLPSAVVVKDSEAGEASSAWVGAGEDAKANVKEQSPPQPKPSWAQMAGKGGGGTDAAKTVRTDGGRSSGHNQGMGAWGAGGGAWGKPRSWAAMAAAPAASADGGIGDVAGGDSTGKASGAEGLSGNGEKDAEIEKTKQQCEEFLAAMTRCSAPRSQGGWGPSGRGGKGGMFANPKNVIAWQMSAAEDAAKGPPPSFEFFERRTPGDRPPLYDCILELAQGVGVGAEDQGEANMMLLEANNTDFDLARSWFAVAWYPILCHSQTANAIRGSFITYHRLTVRESWDDVFDTYYPPKRATPRPRMTTPRPTEQADNAFQATVGVETVAARAAQSKWRGLPSVVTWSVGHVRKTAKFTGSLSDVPPQQAQDPAFSRADMPSGVQHARGLANRHDVWTSLPSIVTWLSGRKKAGATPCTPKAAVKRALPVELIGYMHYKIVQKTWYASRDRPSHPTRFLMPHRLFREAARVSRGCRICVRQEAGRQAPDGAKDVGAGGSSVRAGVAREIEGVNLAQHMEGQLAMPVLDMRRVQGLETRRLRSRHRDFEHIMETYPEYEKGLMESEREIALEYKQRRALSGSGGKSKKSSLGARAPRPRAQDSSAGANSGLAASGPNENKGAGGAIQRKDGILSAPPSVQASPMVAARKQDAGLERHQSGQEGDGAFARLPSRDDSTRGELEAPVPLLCRE